MDQRHTRCPWQVPQQMTARACSIRIHAASQESALNKVGQHATLAVCAEQ
jgi:hypothetical protein